MRSIRLGRFMTHRKASLLCIAWLFGVTGWQLFTQPPVRNAAALAQYSVLFRWLSIHTWGVLWLVAAGLCVLGAFVRRAESIGFTVTELLLCAWATGILIAFLETHFYRGLLSISIYYVLAVLFMIISNWPERIKDAV